MAWPENWTRSTPQQRRDVADLPDLHELASEHFTYADLCHCSETWRLTGVENAPQTLETYRAISELCENVLEPVEAKFGSITLTYGFAGPKLTRKVHGRISPRLDQHAGHERRVSGEFICPRLGQAADFRVPGVSSKVVARFLVEMVPFVRAWLEVMTATARQRCARAKADRRTSCRSAGVSITFRTKPRFTT